MRTLFGAVVGVLLGVAIIAVLTSQFDVQKSWPILFAGLLAGIAMRVTASDDHASYLRGGLAALATVLAMIGGPLVGAKLISQKTLAVAKIIPVVTDAADDAAATSEAGGDLEIEEPLAPAVAIAKPKGPIGGPKQDMDPMEAILMAAGCLIAYQVGKGSEAVALVTDPDPTSDEGGQDSDSEDAGEESHEEA